MLESQLIAFVALAGLMGHGLTLLMREDDEWNADPQDEQPDGLWSSDRFNQSGEGNNRPFFLE
ncbi:hypothetical protein [Azospirillum argentinense]|uniref:hypothetical protein n=1 Tax=Azospirillum argentinense TaxID=2970906 RepID=UPI0032DED389